MFDRQTRDNQTPASAEPKRGFSADAFRRLAVKLADTPVPNITPALAPLPQAAQDTAPAVEPPSPVLPPVVTAAAELALPSAAEPVHVPEPVLEVRPDPVLTSPRIVMPRREIRLDADQARKADLARALIDLMSSGGANQPQERALATDTLLELMPVLRGPILVTLSERVAIMEAPPPALVTQLVCNPDIAVASPLLEDGLQVSDQDLMAVIARGATDKLRLIARRRRLTKEVSEAIAMTGDHSAMLTLIRNAAAEFSNTGFMVLMEAAKLHADLLAPLCTRPDLPPHLAFELFWLAPPALRRFLMSRLLVDSAAMTALLKIKLDIDGEASFAVPEKDSVIAALGSLISGPPEKAYAAVAVCAHIKPATVARIASDNQGEALMALFKVMGIPRSEVSALIQEFAAGAKPLLDPARDPEEVQAIFDQLSFNKARLLLTYWDWSAAGTGPYAERA